MFTPTVENVLSVYRAASDEHMAAGIRWYGDAHQFASLIANGDVLQGAGVIAALSPQTSWSTNMNIAVRAFVEGFASGQTGANCDKANRILKGEDEHEVLGFWGKRRSGHKVRNFFRNIVDPTDPKYVTIDRHAFDVAVGQQTDSKARGQLDRKGEYDRFVRVYQEAAWIAGISPSFLQAITWLTWREAIGLDLD